ncbi:pyrroline-5-carboxylate dehydrogenase [Pelomyxa schiedti]|nr:pyrroline-5-carboxylate dehydrogenase [Pelomyxa schiedti]
MSCFSISTLPTPKNETCRPYPPGSEDATQLRNAINQTLAEVHQVPIVIGGQEIFTDRKGSQVCPSNHAKVLCEYSMATPELVTKAIEAAIAAKPMWEALDYPARLAIFLKAADLLTGKYRYLVNAATMLGQSKTVWQAEIDCIAEIADFWRFNAKYAEEIYSFQPPENSPGCWNRTEFRPLEGFIWALSPFNFTSIGGNLCTAPALMGNVVVWKPASTAVYSNYLIYKVMVEAGLPAGVINFLPGPGAMMGNIILSHPLFSGIHFTGSTEVFDGINATVSKNLPSYKTYPRLVGETGGKDFHFIHESCDVVSAVNNTIRAAFEYQGQKCSACSRVYVPDTIYESQFLPLLKKQMARIRMGQPEDFSTYVCAVIDRPSFTKLKAAIEAAKTSPEAHIEIGGTCDDSKGFFIEPTVIRVTNPKYVTMAEELFGPILTLYVYRASEVDEALRLCDETSPYALTGSIFSRDVYFTQKALLRLRQASGNVYINDKCTGAVVGQQPFGGARKSGTNDKAGEKYNLLRWVSVRTIKETFVPLNDFGYPHMGGY